MRGSFLSLDQTKKNKFSGGEKKRKKIKERKTKEKRKKKSVRGKGRKKGKERISVTPHFPGVPLTTVNLRKTCVSHIMRLIHE